MFNQSPYGQPIHPMHGQSSQQPRAASGAKKHDWAAVQKALREEGIPLEVTGKADECTCAALRALYEAGAEDLEGLVRACGTLGEKCKNRDVLAVLSDGEEEESEPEPERTRASTQSRQQDEEERISLSPQAKSLIANGMLALGSLGLLYWRQKKKEKQAEPRPAVASLSSSYSDVVNPTDVIDVQFEEVGGQEVKYKYNDLTRSEAEAATGKDSAS